MSDVSSGVVKGTMSTAQPSPERKLAPDEVLLSEAQYKVINRLMTRQSTFFTGAAGTGKSYIVTLLLQVLKKLELTDRLALTAPTGVAACNISGMTIHSWAGIGIGTNSTDSYYKKIMSRGARNEELRDRWKKTEILVIDEVSMLSADLFEKIAQLGSLIRKDKRPFGGIQVILCGDFFQLPPISKGGKFCFQSPVWSELLGPEGSVVLDKVFRQKDGPFVRLLNDMRRGVVTPEGQSILTQKMYDTQAEMRAAANKENAPEAKAGSQSNKIETLKHTCLFSKNADCDRANEVELDKLPLINKTSEGDLLSQDEGRHFIYTADESGSVEMLKNFKAPQELELRVGAQVMMLKNLDQERGLINGSRGIVTHFVDFDQDNREIKAFSKQPLPVVQFHINRGGEQSVITEVIQPANFEVTLGEKVLACRRQLPLMLAWAVSIHKSQGLTIPFLNVSFDGIFEYGQAYVALSRATDMVGLRLRNFAPHYIKAHPEVKAFYEALGYDINESEKISTDLRHLSVSQLCSQFVRQLPPGPEVDPDAWIDATSGRGSKKRRSSNTIAVDLTGSDSSKRDVRAKLDRHGDPVLASGKDGGVVTAEGTKVFSMFAYKAEPSSKDEKGHVSVKTESKMSYQQRQQQNLPSSSGHGGGGGEKRCRRGEQVAASVAWQFGLCNSRRSSSRRQFPPAPEQPPAAAAVGVGVGAPAAGAATAAPPTEPAAMRAAALSPPATRSSSSSSSRTPSPEESLPLPLQQPHQHQQGK